MNYQKIHDQIIEKAKLESRTKYEGIYYEEHHINPKCLGGNNLDSNLILLTAREHFLIHWLLTKIYPKEFKLIYAFNSFCLNQKGKRPTSHLYKFAREKFIKYLKENKEWKEKMANTMSKLIWIKRDNVCIRVTEIDFIEKYIDDGWSRGRIILNRKPHSQKTKNKIRNKALGRTKTKETKLKNSESNKALKKLWINNGSEELWISKDDIDKYEKYNKGRLKRIYVNNGKNEKRIKINEPIPNGYNKGRIEKPKKAYKQVWINNGYIVKHVSSNQLEKYLKQGFKIGRSLKG